MEEVTPTLVRPEMRRLAVSKMPLRETRSLDDSQSKGIITRKFILLFTPKVFRPDMRRLAVNEMPFRGASSLDDS